MRYFLVLSSFLLSSFLQASFLDFSLSNKELAFPLTLEQNDRFYVRIYDVKTLQRWFDEFHNFQTIHLIKHFSSIDMENVIADKKQTTCFCFFRNKPEERMKRFLRSEAQKTRVTSRKKIIDFEASQKNKSELFFNTFGGNQDSLYALVYDVEYAKVRGFFTIGQKNYIDQRGESQKSILIGHFYLDARYQKSFQTKFQILLPTYLWLYNTFSISKLTHSFLSFEELDFYKKLDLGYELVRGSEEESSLQRGVYEFELSRVYQQYSLKFWGVSDLVNGSSSVHPLRMYEL